MATIRQYHLAMMINALWKDDEYLANLHRKALNRLAANETSDYCATDIRREKKKGKSLCFSTDKTSKVLDGERDTSTHPRDRHQDNTFSTTMTGPPPHRKKREGKALNVTIFTGAGISAESNIPTFRDLNGIYENYPLEIVTTANGWKASKDLLISFWDKVKDMSCSSLYKPNDAHHAIARLQNMYDSGQLLGEFHLITSNVDTLHEQAGCHDVLKIHGDLSLPMRTIDMDGDKYEMPDVVLFGERTRHWDAMWDAVSKSDLFLVVGSSLSIGGDSGMVFHAKDTGSRTVEVNTNPTGHPSFDKVIMQPASSAVPSLVDCIVKIAA